MRRELRHVVITTATLSTVLALSACSARLPSSDSRPTAPSSQAPRASESAAVEGAGNGDVPHDENLPAHPDALSEAADFGTAALAAFCRPSLNYEAWIGELYPFLSQAAGAAYETVDPANVPCTAVTGEPVIRDGDDPYTVGLGVPTDVGEYAVYLHRTGADAPWAVEQITPVSAD